MDIRLTWTDCDEAGDYVVPNVLSLDLTTWTKQYYHHEICVCPKIYRGYSLEQPHVMSLYMRNLSSGDSTSPRPF